MIKNVPTICSFCSCGCGMFIRVEGDEPIGILPRIDHPVSAGRLCHRGWNRYQNLRSTNRVLRPLQRTGSGFQEISWDKALQIIKEELAKLQDNFGAEAIGLVRSPWLSNEDNFALILFGQKVLQTKSVDGSYRFSGASTLVALNRLWGGSVGSLGTVPEVGRCSSVLVLGRDSYEDFAPVGARIIQAFKQGAKIVLADPVSDRVEHFIKYKLPYSLEELLGFFVEKKGLAPEVLNVLSKSSSALIFVAEQYQPAKSLGELIGFLVSVAEKANQLPQILPLSRSPNLRGAWDMGFDEFQDGKLNLQEMLVPESPIQGLLVFGDDLLRHLPASVMIEKVKSLKFVMVADRFFNETIRSVAHLVLPLPLFGESNGTLTNCEGRVQSFWPALPIPGEVRNLQEILSLIAETQGQSFSYSLKELRKEIGQKVPGYQKIALEEWVNSGFLLDAPKIKPQNILDITRKTDGNSEFTLMIPNTLWSWSRNQMILESAVLQIAYPPDRAVVKMSGQDMKELKIRPGEKVKIISPNGEIQVPVETQEGILRRVLVLPSHILPLVEGLCGKGVMDPATRSFYYPNVKVKVEKM